MSASLVGSEMCIRDRDCTSGILPCRRCQILPEGLSRAIVIRGCGSPAKACLLYTSDAADDM
eukprot:2158103-Alexandrium_andersonii.AAC.1